MFAMVGVYRFDPAEAPEDERRLVEQVVPFVRHQPGFVSGAWSRDRGARRYHTFVVFETERAAQGVVAFLRDTGTRGRVVLESLSVVEVLAQAGGR